MAPRDFLWYDVFTDRRFAGNPLAVFPDAAGLSDDDMRDIARELNLSETTFVLPVEDPATTHRVRIFTPGRELAFAGHPTVGTAIAIAELEGRAEADLVLGLGAGPTPVQVRRGASGALRATFVAPQLPRLQAAPAEVAAVAEMLGITVDDVDPALPLHLADAGGTAFVVVLVRSLEVLARCRPAGECPGVVGVYATTRTEGGFQSRMFAPGVGVPEDPATGSATVAFAGSLVAHVDGFGSDGAHAVALRQGVEMGRPSDLALEFDVANGRLAEVRLAGAAVRVLAGQVASANASG